MPAQIRINTNQIVVLVAWKEAVIQLGVKHMQ